MARTLIVLLLCLFAAGAASAQQLPELTAPVNDFANVIDAAREREIDARIRALERASGDVIIVATVDTFAPFASIEEMAVKMFENHRRGVGQKGQDNGALILVAIQERKVRIEVGYGLEEHITDSFAGQTVRDIITPRFRRGEMGAGLLEGTTALVNRIAARRGVTLEGAPKPASSRRQRKELPPWLHITLIIVGLILFTILPAASAAMSNGTRKKRSRRGPWSGWHGGVGPFGGGAFGGGFGRGVGGGGGGLGGGFGGFGGGRSGGGGASGSW